MIWNKLHCRIDAEQEVRLSEALQSLGAQSLCLENATAVPHFDAERPRDPEWKQLILSALFLDEINKSKISDDVKAQMNVSAINLWWTEIEDQDWHANWKSRLQPIRVATDLWICPSWCDPIDTDAHNLILDPGTAFGTGTHATTRLCLEWLSKCSLGGLRVLDFGCGSGILAIAAALYGAERVVAVDIDDDAVTTCKTNVSVNACDKQIVTYHNDEWSSREQGKVQYDLIIANILSETLIDLGDTLVASLAEGGRLLLTGILHSQSERVTSHYSPPLSMTSTSLDEWVLLEGIKRTSPVDKAE